MHFMGNLRLSTGIRFGLVTSGLQILIGLALFFAGLVDYSGETSGWVSFLVLLLGLYLASEHFKKQNENYLGTKDMIVISLWLGILVGIISGIYAVVYMQMDPTIIEKTMNMTEARLEGQGVSDEQIKMTLNMMEKFFSPGYLIAASLLMNLIFSVFIGTILGLILKKERPIFD